MERAGGKLISNICPCAALALRYIQEAWRCKEKRGTDSKGEENTHCPQQYWLQGEQTASRRIAAKTLGNTLATMQGGLTIIEPIFPKEENLFLTMLLI